MALVLADRVQETCTSPGTGAVTLLGAVTGYQTFNATVGNGNTCYYCIADQGGSNWEVGVGTYASSGNTLTRTTPLSGSAATPVNFSSGTQSVFVTYPAEKSVNLDASGNVSALGTITSGVWNGSTLPVAYGGTGVTTSTGTGDNVLSTNPVLTTPNLGTPSAVTLTNASGLPLTSGVSGVLPTANGGTNLSSFTSGGAVYATSTSALTTGTLPIASGGTGQTTASTAFNALSPITTEGDLIVGNGANSATRLGIGTSGYVLTSNGTTAAWAAVTPTGSTYTRTSFTATGGQTTFTVAYTVGYVEVFLNGVLLNNSDYTASNGTTVILSSAASAGDIVETIAYSTTSIGTASSSTNLAGGTASQIPYQSSTGTTSFITNGTSGQALVSAGSSAPAWGTLGVSGGGTGVTSSTGTGSVVLNTSPSLTTPTTTGTKETKAAIAASDIDMTLGNYFTKTISTTTTFTVSNVASSGTVNSFVLDLTNGGSSTVNWWTGVKWAGATAPTLTASGRDVLGFFTEDGGTTWNGFVLGLNLS